MLSVVSLTLYFHLSWFFNLGDARAEAATGGLVFMLFPLYAILGGAMGYALGYFLGSLAAREIDQTGSPLDQGAS